MKKSIIFPVLLFFLASCSRQIEDVFDRSSAERIHEEIARTEDVLTSASNGWVMEYYADPQYGGYNIICRFNDDNTVTVQSELFGEAVVTSHYRVDQSQGVILSFDEYNEIFHYFSDPGNPDGIGQDGDGMLGDFEFRVISANADEVVLKGKKHGVKVVMTPLAKDSQWNDYLTAVIEFEEKMYSRSYNFHFGETTVVASLSYNQLSFIDEESGKTIAIPFIYTPKGYKFYRELEYAGRTVKELFYSEEDGNCYAADDKSVYLEKKPMSLSEAFASGMWFFSGETMSESALEKFLECKQGSASESENIEYMYFGYGLSDATANRWGLGFISGPYFGMLFFSATLDDEDTVTLKYTSNDGGNGDWYMSNASYDVLSSLLSSTFDLSTDNLKDPSYIKMEDTKNPEVWMTLHFEEINLPFGEYNN